MNVTQWSSKYHMLDTYVKMYDKLLDVVQNERASAIMDMSQGFATQVKKYFRHIDQDQPGDDRIINDGNETFRMSKYI